MRESCILTASGRHFDYLNPQADQIDIRDIARALSRESRFNGHTRTFYSVADHSFRVAMLVPAPFRMEAILHDASEAYLKDLPSPLKALLPDYKALEDRVDQAIRLKFGLPLQMSPEVHHADMVLRATEKRDLMPRGGFWADLEGIEPLPDHLEPLSAKDAEYFFLAVIATFEKSE